MRLSGKVVSVLVILLLIGTSFQGALAKSYEDDSSSETRSPPVDGIPGPFRELDTLVARLIEATVDMTDTDGDALPDSVERVIGTDPDNPDSDCDLVPDMDEVTNRTDPMNPDSNRDGLPDGNEVIDDILDIDGDGVPNTWDSDNDADGVPDSRDLTPFAATAADWNFHLDMVSSGKATTVSFQIRTSRTANMRLVNQVYDWPYDTEGEMQDLDNSTEDLVIVPILEVRCPDIHDSTELDEFGIMAIDGTAYLPLYPIWHQGNVVALQAQMFFPASTSPRDIPMDISLNWKVTGSTDKPLISVKAPNDKYLSVNDEGTIRANASEVGPNELFEVVDLGDGKVTLKAANGKYLYSWFGSELCASATSINNGSIILVEARGEGGLRSMMVENVHTRSFPSEDGGGSQAISVTSPFFLRLSEEDDNSIQSVSTDYREEYAFIVEDQGYKQEPTPLAVYPDKFALTGCYVEEAYGTEVALVYHNDSMDQAIGANLYLAYQFLRNASNDALGLPGLLWGEGFDLGVDVRSFPRMDLAVKALAEGMVKQVKNTFPEGDPLAVITAIQQRYTAMDLSSLGQGTIDASAGLTFDIASRPLTVKKYLKTNWYNSTEDEPVPVAYVVWKIKDWALEMDDLTALSCLIVSWNVGEEFVVKVGQLTYEPACPEHYLAYNITKKVMSYGYKFFKYVIKIIIFAKQAVTAYNVLSSAGGLKSIATLFLSPCFLIFDDNWLECAKLVSGAFSTVSKIQHGFFGVMNWLNGLMKWLAPIGLFLELGVAVVTFHAIASSYHWSALGIYTATLYMIMMGAWAIAMFVLTLLSFIPKVGLVFTLISTLIAVSNLLTLLIFGKSWVQMVMDLIVDALTDVKLLARMTADSEAPEVAIDDKDGNGLDAGDRITYRQLMEVYTDYEGLSLEEVNKTYMRPYINVSVPRYTNSPTGHSLSEDVHWEESRNFRRTELVSEAWVEPGRGMVNFPVTVWITSEYRTYYVEYFWPFHVQKSIDDTVYSAPFTIYFDVMPGSVADFASWREIRSQDTDGDGLPDHKERSRDRYRWDTDGDGLGDGYEREMGTNVFEMDSDHDGLDDRREHIWGSDPNERDTDGDGLSDHFEHSGWVVSFVYEGTTFDWHVSSDPLQNDTDGDGLSDHEEYLTLQNPRSGDTDGDGTPDELRDYRMTTFEHLSTVDTMYQWPTSIAMAPDGTIYVAAAAFDQRTLTIQKYLPNWTLEMEWGDDIIFDAIHGITCDAHGNVYAADQRNGCQKFDPNGTWLAQYGKTGEEVITSAHDVAIDEDGFIYVIDSNYSYPYHNYSVYVMDENGTFSHRFGSTGSGDGQFQGPRGITIDDEGLVWVTDAGNDRVVVHQRDGTFLRSYDGTGPGSEAIDGPVAVSIDSRGDIFVLEGGNRRFQKMGPEGGWIASFNGTDTTSGLEMDPQDILVTEEDLIYVVDRSHEGVLRIQQDVSIVKVEPKDFVDTDGDGLDDAVEGTPWSISFTDPSGSHTIDVTSDPMNPDTDGDGLGDLEEYNASTNPQDPDTDHDGLGDLREIELGTDPNAFDSDGDLLFDGVELDFGSDPLMEDTDGEGLSDYEELRLHSDPRDNDTDDDGLEDLEEVGFSSNLTDADTDDDFMFDGRERDVGATATETDYDHDGLKDGFEDVFGTDATSDDSDGDTLADGLEVSMMIDPLSNDTDGDGLTDGVECARGLNPRSGDTDHDGVPDRDDTDHEIALEGDVYVVVDPFSDMVGFVDDLSSMANVVVEGPGDLLANHTGARYIVLVGDPVAREDTAGNITYGLLEDAPEVRDRMNSSSEGRLVVRYGAWAREQTIVMLSRAYPSDACRVVGILKSVVVDVTENGVSYRYLNPRSSFLVDDMDAIGSTDTAVWAELEGATQLSLAISVHTAGSVSDPLSRDSGLGADEVSLDRYVEVEVSGGPAGDEDVNVTHAVIWLYYTPEDLDRTGDGDADDPGDIDEATLALYALDEGSGNWSRLTPELDWVEGGGVDTTDLVVFGRGYGGCIWANVTHLSIFGIGGRPRSGTVATARPGPDVRVKAGGEVTFDGTGSTGNGEIVNYTWTFFYKGEEVSLYGPGPAFEFERAGRYPVTLKVTDGTGDTDEATLNVTVEGAEGEGTPGWVLGMAIVIVLVLLVALLWMARGRPSGTEDEDVEEDVEETVEGAKEEDVEEAKEKAEEDVEEDTVEDVEEAKEKAEEDVEEDAGDEAKVEDVEEED